MLDKKTELLTDMATYVCEYGAPSLEKQLLLHRYEKMISNAVEIPALGPPIAAESSARSVGELITISHPLYQLPTFSIMKNLVTVAQYRQFCQAVGKQMPTAPRFNPDWSKEDHPIVNVSWYDAVDYCEWAGMTLPTEAQWKLAAYGTDGRQFPWGDEWDSGKCQCYRVKDSTHGTAPVGSYPEGASPYGVLDMAGNVWEWCADWYDGDRNGRVLRGGSWFYTHPDGFRAAYRVRNFPGVRGSVYGFRCASAGEQSK